VSEVYVHTVASMATIVSIQVVGHGDTANQRQVRDEAVRRAVQWFERIEADCSRFDARSEIRRLSTQIDVPVRVSPLVFRVVEFALAVARESGGAFDPTVGADMEARGFDRDDRTGRTVESGVTPRSGASFHDVTLDPDECTITLSRPVLLDLGGVAKGLAVDLATQELRPLEDFAIDAGGDLYLGGRNVDGDSWRVGIRHPRQPNALIETLHLSDVAVCTSGDYERLVDGAHHLLDPTIRAPAVSAASVTVVSSSAMVADALATAAFVLGPTKGLALLEQHDVDGLIVTPELERFATERFAGFARGTSRA
jgi:thiamine biosynthesis lipoprotein